jgi:hypothetical protein
LQLRWKTKAVAITQIAAVTFGILSYVAFGFGAYAFIGLAHHNGEFSGQVRKPLHDSVTKD